MQRTKEYKTMWYKNLQKFNAILRKQFLCKGQLNEWSQCQKWCKNWSQSLKDKK